MERVFIFGAASAIATATAINFAKQGAHLYLTDLSAERLDSVKKHILTFAKTEIHIDTLNALETEKHEELINKAAETLGGLDYVLIAHGTLPNQEKAQSDNIYALKEFAINGTSVISLATVAANFMEKQGRGCIAVISSVAGDRGRQSNYLYGSAKGAVSIFLQGLRNRFAPKGINVLTIKPGFVDTPMTAHLPKNPLYASAEKVGGLIHQAMIKGKDVVYTPGFWKLIMLMIKLIPEGIFKKLKL